MCGVFGNQLLLYNNRNLKIQPATMFRHYKTKGSALTPIPYVYIMIRKRTVYAGITNILILVCKSHGFLNP